MEGGGGVDEDGDGATISTHHVHLVNHDGHDRVMLLALYKKTLHITLTSPKQQRTQETSSSAY